MKNYLTFLFIAVLGFFAPIQYFFVLSLYLVTFDSIFAMVVKKRINKKRKKLGLEEDLSLTITSNRFLKMFPKILLYYSGLILGYMTDIIFEELILSILGSVIMMPFTYFFLLIIVFRELMSIDETLRLANNKKGLEFYFEAIVDKIKLIKKTVGELFK